MNRPTASELHSAYVGKRVLLTGHTGFKGSWLSLWLSQLGAHVTGLALAPDTNPALFDVAAVGKTCTSVLGDIRDRTFVHRVVRDTRPDVIFHLAAQPLVRRSYQIPLETIETNVLGTANVLEAVRVEGRPCAVVVATSDKCYENREWSYGYRETEPMGGHDVYSMSKGAAELVVASYRRSFFAPEKLATHGVGLASARAGNVVGGGDWAPDRIMVEIVDALANHRPIEVRSPNAVRPWQHVLEPLSGYLLLGARLTSGDTAQRAAICEAWNFGPRLEDARPVRELVEGMVGAWGSGSWVDRRDPHAPHEAGLLRLSIEKAQSRLGWMPRWDFTRTLRETAAWYRAKSEASDAGGLQRLCLQQINTYMES